MNSYVLGLDGGGTKTELAAAQNGKELFRIRGGAINLNGLPRNQVEENLATLLKQAQQKMGQGAHCAAVCVGAAGISNPSVIPAITEITKKAIPEALVSVVGDQDTALAGAHSGGEGILIIAGTGSICIGKNAAGKTHRTGGLGHIIDDLGSAYDIGRQILSAVVSASDGRAPKTPLTDMVYSELGITEIRGLVEYVYKPGQGKDAIARFSALLPTAAKQGDAAALSIIENAAASLAGLVLPVAEKLNLQSSNLALGGSVLQKDEFIRPAFEKNLAKTLPNLNCALPKQDATSGAIILAQNML